MHRGDSEFSVFRAEGTLRHWSAEKGAGHAAFRDDIAGLYDIGDGGAVLDLTGVRPREVSTWPNDPSHLIVRLDENTTLEIVEQEVTTDA